MPRTSSSSTVRRHYEEKSESTTLDRVPSNCSPANCVERYEVSSNFRKSWSGHFKHSVTTSDCASRSDEDVSRAASGSLHRTTSLDSITSRQAADKIFSRILMIPAMMGSFLPLSPPPQAYQSCPRPTLIGTPLRCVCVCVCVYVSQEMSKPPHAVLPPPPHAEDHTASLTDPGHIQ